MKIIRSTVDFNDHIRTHKGVLFYFATTSCSVGEALEPKVQKLLHQKYPKLEYCSIDMNLAAELSAAHQVFVEPTILLFLEGKEYLRKSRHIGLVELDMSIGRIYDLAFE
jgi:thioredoxin 1